jgi:hypothetical protein
LEVKILGANTKAIRELQHRLADNQTIGMILEKGSGIALRKKRTKPWRKRMEMIGAAMIGAAIIAAIMGPKKSQP